MKDGEILALLLNRDERGISELQNEYGRYSEYISMNILADRSDAEECVNDALSAAWNSIPPHKPGNLRTYFGKLTREISISRWRKNHAEKRCSSEFCDSLEELGEIADDGSIEDSINGKNLSKAISDFLRTLPEAERNIFVRRYWLGDSIKGISERYVFGESKVKVTLKRTRDKLSLYLKKEGYIQ